MNCVLLKKTPGKICDIKLIFQHQNDDRIASTGSSLEADRAGIKPDTSPIIADTEMPRITLPAVRISGISKV